MNCIAVIAPGLRVAGKHRNKNINDHVNRAKTIIFILFKLDIYY